MLEITPRTISFLEKDPNMQVSQDSLNTSVMNRESDLYTWGHHRIIDLEQSIIQAQPQHQGSEGRAAIPAGGLWWHKGTSPDLDLSPVPGPARFAAVKQTFGFAQLSLYPNLPPVAMMSTVTQSNPGKVYFILCFMVHH